jgi:hypothetical protein
LPLSRGNKVSTKEIKSRRPDVPELWIIDDELWQPVKTRQSEIADKYVNVTETIREAQSDRPNGLRRPKALFSGFIHCGEDVLKTRLAQEPMDVLDIHPNVSGIYRKIVDTAVDCTRIPHSRRPLTTTPILYFSRLSTRSCADFLA